MISAIKTWIPQAPSRLLADHIPPSLSLNVDEVVMSNKDDDEASKTLKRFY
ncbi:MAG: hypothetical protein Q7W13_06985 [Bacteroidia bacterium]|nr:hypothetical protein [Bacteroidia bacterium]